MSHGSVLVVCNGMVNIYEPAFYFDITLLLAVS
jgi:hypothetical protein